VIERVYKCALVGLFHCYITSYPLFGGIYLYTAIGFRPGGSCRCTCTEIGKRQLKRIHKETIHKTLHKQYKITEYAIAKTKIQNKKQT